MGEVSKGIFFCVELCNSLLRLKNAFIQTLQPVVAFQIESPDLY
jgi:hypothetical protein